MKDNVHLTTYLDEYLKMDTPQFAVMITGKWGCGKTFYIKERIKTWDKTKISSGEDTIVLKPIYVSVNGLSSVGAVVRKIKTALNPILYSKGAKVAKQVILTTLRIATKAAVDLEGDGAGEDFNSLIDAEGILEVFKSDSSSIKGNRVLVIDDVERCRIPLDELFGFVNSIVEHSNSKVILICDEEKLEKVAQTENLSVEYKDFKEKLVGQTFSLAVDYPLVAGAFIDGKKNPVLTSNRSLIIELFVASKCENLRLMRHCLIDIERFFSKLPKRIESNPNYEAFVKNVMAYLTIVSLECRFGNKEIEHYQSYSLLDEAKEASRKIEGKYNAILERNLLYNSMYIIPVSTLLDFVKNGYLESVDNVISGCRMLQSRNMSDWEKLWRCTKLENDEFATILKKEKRRFLGKQLEYVFEVAHVSGILLSLEKRSLAKLSRKNVERTAKANIEAIFEKYPEDGAHIMLNSQGYEFLESNTSEMKSIITYAQDLFQQQISRIERDYVVKAWEKVGSDVTRNDLDRLFDELTPTRRCRYGDEGIFNQIAPKVMVDKIEALSNASKLEFASFLVARYNLEGSGIIGSVREEMKKDKDALVKISDGLKRRAKRLKLIDKEMTLEIASKMDEAVGKM